MIEVKGNSLWAGLRHHAGLKLLSFFFALLVWMLVHMNPDAMVREAQVRMKVPVRLQNTPPGLIARTSEEGVWITVKGRPSVLENVGPSQLKAVVDLSKVGTGIYPALRVDPVIPAGLDVVEVEPATLPVTLVRRASRKVKVEVQVKGQPAEGYRITGTISEPERVRVSGPETEVEQVAAVRGSVLLRGADRDVAAEVRTLQPVNAEGVIPASLEVEPEAVLVTVQVAASEEPASVPISLENVRVEGPGRWDLRARRQFATLMIPAGKPRPAVLLTEEKVLPAAGGALSSKVRLKVPKGYRLLGSPEVEVTAVPRPVGGAPEVEPPPLVDPGEAPEGAS